jgi:hypothetical protein
MSTNSNSNTTAFPVAYSIAPASASESRGEGRKSGGGSAVATKKRKGKNFEVDAEQLKAKKREKNKVHARESRIRKMYKVTLMLENLKQLWENNRRLKAILAAELPDESESIIQACLVPGTTDYNLDDAQSQRFGFLDENHTEKDMGKDKEKYADIEGSVGSDDTSSADDEAGDTSLVAVDVKIVKKKKSPKNKKKETSDGITSKMENYDNSIPGEVTTEDGEIIASSSKNAKKARSS